MTLQISMRMPDRELEQTLIDRAINKLALCAGVGKLNGVLPEGPTLDITFLLSTAQDKPEFEGMRMGGYSSDANTLYFESAVPAHMSDSPKGERYLMAVLLDAFDNASEFFAEQSVPFDKGQWYQAVADFPGMDNDLLGTAELTH